MISDRLSGARDAEAMLGEEHPLVGALADLKATVRQIAAVATTAGVGLLAIATARSWGAALTLAAALVALVLAGRLLVVLDATRRHACDVIIAGSDRLPIAVVQGQRRRLLDRAGRERLAGAYYDLGRAALQSARRVATLLPHATPDVVTAVGRDLVRVAAALCAGDVDVRGVALAERLLTDGASPLYGSDVDELRRELRRVAWHFGVAEPGDDTSD